LAGTYWLLMASRNLPASFSNLRPSVMTHLALMAEQGLEIDTLGIPGAVLSQIGIGTPGLTIVMDHVADKPTNFDVDDPWKADMLAASTYTGRNIKVSGVHKLNSQILTRLRLRPTRCIGFPQRMRDCAKSERASLRLGAFA
jgi:hypothetical protein